MLLIQTKREQSRLFKGFATLTVVWREHTTPRSHSGIAPPAVKRQRYKGVGGSVGVPGKRCNEFWRLNRKEASMAGVE